MCGGRVLAEFAETTGDRQVECGNRRLYCGPTTTQRLVMGCCTLGFAPSVMEVCYLAEGATLRFDRTHDYGLWVSGRS